MGDLEEMDYRGFLEVYELIVVQQGECGEEYRFFAEPTLGEEDAGGKDSRAKDDGEKGGEGGVNGEEEEEMGKEMEQEEEPHSGTSEGSEPDQ